MQPINFTKDEAGKIFADMTGISESEAYALKRYTTDRGLISTAWSDGLYMHFGFYVPENWDGEAHATRYLDRILGEVRFGSRETLS